MLGRGYIDKLGHSSADWEIADLEVMIRGHPIMEQRIFYVYERGEAETIRMKGNISHKR